MGKKLGYSMIVFLCLCMFVGCNHAGSDKKDQQKEEENVSAGHGQNPLFSESAYREKLCKGRTNLKQYQEQYQEDISRIQEKEYRKLSFDQCVFAELPDSDSVSVLDYGKRGISVEESISVIRKWLADIGQEDMDLDTELRDVSGQFETDDSQEPPYYYPSVMEHKEELASGDHFLINTNSCHVQMGEDGMYSMSDGTIISYLGEDGHAINDAFRVEEQEIVAEGTLDEMASQSYELLSGKISVAEAAEVAKRYFEAGTPFPPEADVGIDIFYVSVFSLGNKVKNKFFTRQVCDASIANIGALAAREGGLQHEHKYGYAFQMRRTYQNIPFAYTFGGSRRKASARAVFEDDKTAYVVNDRTVSAFIGYNEAQPLPVLINESDILSLKDAMDLLDGKLAGELQIQVERAGLVYCNVSLDDEKGISVVYPSWELDGLSRNQDRRIRIYMDVLTGDLNMHTYPQAEETDEDE